MHVVNRSSIEIYDVGESLSHPCLLPPRNVPNLIFSSSHFPSIDKSICLHKQMRHTYQSFVCSFNLLCLGDSFYVSV